MTQERDDTIDGDEDEPEQPIEDGDKTSGTSDDELADVGQGVEE